MALDSTTASRQFGNRKGFMDFLEHLMQLSEDDKYALAKYGGEYRGKQAELKTYIMESNNLPGKIANSDVVVQPFTTDLPTVNVWRIFFGKINATFYVDSTDPRFLVLYTNDLAHVTDNLYKKLVHTTKNKFDQIWLPKDVLYKLTKLPGNTFKGFGLRFDDYFSIKQEDENYDAIKLSAVGALSSDVLRVLSEKTSIKKTISFSKVRVLRGVKGSCVTDELQYLGRLITIAGNSVDYHVNFVEVIKRTYRQMIEVVEENRIGIKKVEGRTLLEGQAFDFVLDRKIDDLDSFADVLLDQKTPFRLWGLRSKILPEMRRIVGVDLHTGDPIDLEVTPSLIRVYVPKGACGNTALRLFVNLQHTWD